MKFLFLLVSLSSIVVSTRLIPVFNNPHRNALYANGTVFGFNEGNPFPFRIDCFGNLIVDARLYDGADDGGDDKVFFPTTSLSERDTNISVDGYRIHVLSLTNDSAEYDYGFFGIGPGSFLMEHYGPIAIVYDQSLFHRFIAINATNFSNFFCIPDSEIIVPISIRPISIMLMEFSLGVNGSIVSTTEAEPIVLSGVSSYMSVPASVATELSNFILGQDCPLYDTNNENNIPIRFFNCRHVIPHLPDLVLSFVDSGTIIQSSTEYLVISEYYDEFEFRFSIAEEGEVFGINPFMLDGINLKFEDNHIRFCDPL